MGALGAGLWLAAVLAGASWFFLRRYGFPILSMDAWGALWRHYQAGGAIAFAFLRDVALLAGGALAGLPFAARGVGCRLAGRRLPPPRPAVPPAAAESSRDEDLASLNRAIALIEVWAEPAPSWMVAALKRELAALSPDGWSLMVQFGSAARRLEEKARDLGVLPR